MSLLNADSIPAQVDKDPRLVTKVELSQQTNLSKKVITKLMAEGLPHFRLGYRTVRFHTPDVFQWLQTKRVGRRTRRAA